MATVFAWWGSAAAMTALSRLGVCRYRQTGAPYMQVTAQRVSLGDCRVDRCCLKRILFAASGTG